MVDPIVTPPHPPVTVPQPLPTTVAMNPPMVGAASPFERVDGQNRDLILEAIRAWARGTLVDWAGAWQTDLTKWLSDTEGWMDSWTAEVVRYVQDVLNAVINNSITVQDPLVAELIGDELSATRLALDAFLIDNHRNKGRELTSLEYGITTDLAPVELAHRIQEFWDYTAANDIRAVMLPGTYLVDHFPEQPEIASILVVPAKADIEFRHGFLIKRTYHPEIEKTWSRMISILETSNDCRLSGRLEMDGGGDLVPWYFEHNHCLFVYNAKNVDATGLKLVAYNAMGDNLSISGQGNTEGSAPYGASENVWFGTVDLGRARRKSLVVEATVNSGIYNAKIDNPTSGCFDYEPFNINLAGRVLSFNLRNLHATGGIDLTAGAAPTVLMAMLTGDDWTIVAREGQTLIPYQSYGLNLKLKRLTIDARKFVGGSSATDLVPISHTGVFDVGTVEIIGPDVVPQRNLFSAQATTSGSPRVSIGTMKLSGKTPTNVLLSAVGHIESLVINGIDSPSTLVSLGSSAGNTNTGAALTLDTIELLNCYNVDSLIVPQAISPTVHRVVNIGLVSVQQSDLRVSANLYKAWILDAYLRLIIRDISYTPGSLAAICATLPGAVPLIRSRNFPEESHYFGSNVAWTPEGVYAAAAGTKVMNVAAGKVWVKTTAATINTGWVAQA